MPSVVMLPSGRFRGFAQVQAMRDNQTFDRRDEALRWAEKTEGRMRLGQWVKPVKVAPKAVVRDRTVLDVQLDYIKSEEWLQKAETTRRAEASKQKAVIAALGNKPIEMLDVDDVRAFVAKRRADTPTRGPKDGSSLKGHTVRLELAALSAICNHAVECGWIKTNPAHGVKRPRGDRRMARVDDELMGKIFDHDAIGMDGKAYYFFVTLFSTVCRPGELASARREWLRGDFPQIHVPRTKNDDARVIVIPRQLFSSLNKWLDEQPSDCPYIFGTKKLKGDGWSPYNYATPWRKVRKDLKLGELGVVAYTSRHEGISRLFEQTKLSDGQIAGLSGHRSAQALWHYKHLRNEHQRPTIENLGTVVNDAISRAASHLHPSKPKGPGDFLDAPPPPEKKRRSRK